MSQQSSIDPYHGGHYSYEYQGIRFDPYRLFWLYHIDHPCQQHAIKKLLRAGTGHKTLKQDIQESIGTLNRWLAMLEEDRANHNNL